MTNERANKKVSPQRETGLPTGENFDVFFTAVANSSILKQIWLRAYGTEYPEEATPSSFVTRTDLRRIVQALHLQGGDTFADLACGVGGPGLWIAQETGASLIGIDFSSIAIQLARKSAQERGLDRQAQFQVSNVVATGLPDVSLDGAISIDAFQLFPNPSHVAAEIARILKPDGRFVFTAMVWEGSSRAKTYRTAFEENGFTVEEKEELPDQKFRKQIMEDILIAQSALIAEMGEIAKHTILAEAQELSSMPPTRHMLFVARKQ